jgi:hypothetical protein
MCLIFVDSFVTCMGECIVTKRDNMHTMNIFVRSINVTNSFPFFRCVHAKWICYPRSSCSCCSSSHHPFDQSRPKRDSTREERKGRKKKVQVLPELAAFSYRAPTTRCSRRQAGGQHRRNHFRPVLQPSTARPNPGPEPRGCATAHRILRSPHHRESRGSDFALGPVSRRAPAIAATTGVRPAVSPGSTSRRRRLPSLTSFTLHVGKGV